MTQEQLAEAVHVDRSFLSDVERGQSSPSLDWLCDVADTLGINAWELLADIPRTRQRRSPRKASPRGPAPR